MTRSSAVSCTSSVAGVAILPVLAVLAAVAVLAALAPPHAPARAHTRSVSHSTWTLDGTGATVVLKVSLRDLTSLTAVPPSPGSPLTPELAARLQESVVLRDATGDCAPSSAATTLAAVRGWLRVRWTVRCAAAPIAIQSAIFPNVPGHVHFATVAQRTHVLSVRGPEAAIAAAAPASLPRYIALGVEHILTGWDHVLFVLLLIVAARRLGDVAGLVTGFTIGHSITLALSALEVVVAFARPVEAAIAASIVVVAVENVWLAGGQRTLLPVFPVALIAGVAWAAGIPAFWGVLLFTACYFALLYRRGGWSAWLRWPLACIFGLLHGFGFARVLTEQGLGAPAIGSLFGFNLGVELGQLGVVLLAWPLLVLLRRTGAHRAVLTTVSLAGATLAAYALVVRAFG